MTTSIFIAKLFAIVYLAVGLGALINSKYYTKMMKDMMKERSLLYFGGILALIAGFLLVSYHNIWEKSWVVVITIVGYLALIKGVLLLVAPEWSMEFFLKLFKVEKLFPLIGVVAMLVGLFFGYFGFVA